MLRVAIVHLVVSVTQAPLWIAHEQGLFAKHGIDVQLLLPKIVARSITSDVPFGVLGLPAAMAAVAEGRDLKVLVTLSSGPTDAQLVVRPGIKTPGDLRGKRFGARVGLGSWISAMQALDRLGLDPKRDRISFVDEQGGTAQALEAGRIDAGMVDPAHSTELRSKGFSVLLDMRAANIPGVLTALVVHGAYLREHPDVVEKVVPALVEGIAYSLAPGNKQIVLKTLMTHYGLKSPEAAERGYESLLARVNRKPYASAAAMKETQQVMALHVPKVLEVKVEDMIEDRFVHKLDQSGELDRIYSAYGTARTGLTRP